MAATLGLIKNITEAVLGIGEVAIDNFTFKLFYKWSDRYFTMNSMHEFICSSSKRKDTFMVLYVQVRLDADSREFPGWLQPVLRHPHTLRDREFTPVLLISLTHLHVQSIDDVYWTEDAADEDMMNTYCWMYGHLNLPYDYMVGPH